MLCSRNETPHGVFGIFDTSAHATCSHPSVLQAHVLGKEPLFRATVLSGPAGGATGAYVGRRSAVNQVLISLGEPNERSQRTAAMQSEARAPSVVI